MDAAPNILHQRLQHPRELSYAQTSTLLEQVLQPTRKLLAAPAPRYLTAGASSSGRTSLLLRAEELETLTALYLDLGGPDWYNKDNWLSGSTPCGNGTVNSWWYGVECTTSVSTPGTNSSSYVTGLGLPQNNLVGELPPLHSLQHLLHVNLFGNTVGGALDALCSLGNLTSILLASNNITGSIPQCIQSLANATVLDLDFNAIQGTTPDEVCRLHNLEELHLRSNRLQGTVPSCIGKDLNALRILDYSNVNEDYIFGNQLLSGVLPLSLCDLEHLEILQFQATQELHGTLPDCLGDRQPQLQVLDFSLNQLQRSIPSSLCRATALKSLDLHENLLTGTLPNCLGNLSQLTVLDLDTNQIHGSISENLCQASTLISLNLYDNALSGTLPSCLGSLSQLVGMYLGTNLFHGSIPEELCQASALDFLFLGENALTGTLPNCLGQLTFVRLDTNQLHGPIPEELCQTSVLEYLSLAENALTGTLPRCLWSISQLVALDLSTNDFYGPIPEEVCQASVLEILYLGENALTGTLPSCLANISQLSSLYLETNQLRGPIPENLCNASALNVLSLYDNSLTGTLPNCFGNLSQLAWLYLNINQFYGPIPEELCQLNMLARLGLAENAMTGTIPSCLGNSSQLADLELHTNQLRGSLPEELCQLNALVLLFLEDNILTGSLPSCFTTSFPLLQVMLLHDNDLVGVVPSEWELPSLVSVMLSNNPKLSGSLSSSLFFQQAKSSTTGSSSSPNLALRAVVVEGTSIGGTLPTALCSVPQLVTLALSGNKLMGSLPNCISSLQNLQTLRVSNNHLTGTLPVAIDNMTSLKVLDLSSNEIRGRVPSALGDVSGNLDTVHLQLNRLSCDLPDSVLNWQAPSANVSFDMLDGNLFGCGASTFSGFMALTIQGAAGLRNANKQAFDAYNCGNSAYVLPVITVTFLVLPVIAWLVILQCRGQLALRLRIIFECMANPSMRFNELDHAVRQIRVLALGVMVASIVAGSVALVLSLRVANSAYECEYMAAPTVANKYYSDTTLLSIGVGAAASIGLVLGLFPWWSRLVKKYSSTCISSSSSSSSQDNGGSIVQQPLHSLKEDAGARDFDAENMAKSQSEIPAETSFEAIIRVEKFVVLILALAILTIVPNIGYVLVVLSQLPLMQKMASEMAVTLVKTAIGTLLIPMVARDAANLLVVTDVRTFVRFRLRIVIATALSAMTTIVLPVAIVLMTDKRCLLYALEPQAPVDTDVPISYCHLSSSLPSYCLEYATSDSATSTYTPSFAYDGETCVSAVLSVYGPVFFGVVFLAATLPAGVEIIIVPWLAPWCYQNTDSSIVARTGFAFLRSVTRNIWPVLANAGVLPSGFSIGAAKLDYLAQHVVERAFGQMMATLLVALTFGIAVPAVGGACAVAAFVHLLHHRYVLDQIVLLGHLEQPPMVPNLMGCTDIPVGCAVVAVATVVLVWSCGAVGYLEPAVIGCTLLIGLSLTLAACFTVAWWRTFQSKISQHCGRAQSAASSDLSQGIEIETLFGAPEIRTVTNHL